MNGNGRVSVGNQAVQPGNRPAEAHPWGDFTIFGFCPEHGSGLVEKIELRLGRVMRRVDLGSAGLFFFYTTYADTAENEEGLALRFGFLRLPDGGRLSAQRLLDLGIASPTAIDFTRVVGNGLAVCLSKRRPALAAYKTLMGNPGLHYTRMADGILFSDRLTCLTALVDDLELEESVLPMYFLFRAPIGAASYFRGIERMSPGHLLSWDGGTVRQELKRNFHFDNPGSIFTQPGPDLYDYLYAAFERVLSSCLDDAADRGEQAATLLSGGVDSSLLHSILCARYPGRGRSFSYAVQAASFAFEVEYAREAARLLNSRHEFVEVQPQDYPGLLMDYVDAVSAPPVLEIGPCILAVARRVGDQAQDVRFLVSGRGSDSLFGIRQSIKLKGVHLLGKMPGAPIALKTAGTVLRPFKTISRMALTATDILENSRNPDAWLSPSNTVCVYSDMQLIRRCFGDALVLDALRERRAYAAAYLNSAHYLESQHHLELATDVYEGGLQFHQALLSQRREKILPYDDDEILRTAAAIHPDIRYMRGFRPKYLLKNLLEQKTGAPVARKPKGASIFETELYEWMAPGGALRPMVDAIDRPGFLDRAEFERMLAAPDYFLWTLLALDVFSKRMKTWQAEAARVAT